METVTETCKIIDFPSASLWLRIARKYVDHMVGGDPRAAFYYLDYQINLLKLSAVPSVLQKAIEQEYKKRGFSRPPQFSQSG